MGQASSTNPVLTIGNYGEVKDRSLICKMPLGLDEGNVTDSGVFIRPNDGKYVPISVSPASTSQYEGKTMNVFALPPFPQSWKTIIEGDAGIPLGEGVSVPVKLFLMDVKEWRATREYIVDDMPFGKAEYVYVKVGPTPFVTVETPNISQNGTEGPPGSKK